MQMPQLLLLMAVIAVGSAKAAKTPDALPAPCQWDTALPKVNVKIRGLLEVARYHPSPKSRSWSRAYILMPTKGSCIVQVEAPKGQLAPCDGYIVDLVGPVRYGGAVAAYTLTVREIRCLHRY